VGSVLLVEEDRLRRYTTLLTKLFLAEGVAHGHGTLLYSAYESPRQLLAGLPGFADGPASDAVGDVASGVEGMTIAWRYRALPRLDEGGGGGSGSKAARGAPGYPHTFDLTQVMPAAQAAATLHSAYAARRGDAGTRVAARLMWSLTASAAPGWAVRSEHAEAVGPAGAPAAVDARPVYDAILERLQAVASAKYGVSGPGGPAGTVLRIVVHGLGAPLWGADPVGAAGRRRHCAVLGGH